MENYIFARNVREGTFVCMQRKSIRTVLLDYLDFHLDGPVSEPHHVPV